MKVLLIGFGDVGRAVARILLSRNIEVTAVDISETRMDGVNFIKTDALSEELYEFVDLDEYSAAIIALPNDVDALLCIMMIKKKKEDLLVFARCNNPSYREKMSIAGADYVVDISTITSQMILSTIFREEAEKRLLYENIHVRTYTVSENSPLVGRRVEDFDDVLILGIEKDGAVRHDGVIEPGSKIAVVGEIEVLKAFEERFMT
ncbi:NAD-binding protein [Geoglobus acetivorans]|uniref:NAD-binding protein n=1 Tax=Geoglobus acetivorans TaxID=565033 RepID=A0ABZ3H491_GEOAI|nr:TrkA family potassium uptake protein [Geoglobus acetivorans]